jgi:DNA-binding Lrp family transcriptional regulator
MAVQAYVLVDCAPGKPFGIVDAMRKLTGIKTAHAVTGSYDVIAFVQAATMAELGDLLSRHIHRLPGVLKTTTSVVVEKPVARG